MAKKNGSELAMWRGYVAVRCTFESRKGLVLRRGLPKRRQAPQTPGDSDRCRATRTTTRDSVLQLWLSAPYSLRAFNPTDTDDGGSRSRKNTDL